MNALDRKGASGAIDRTVTTFDNGSRLLLANFDGDARPSSVEYNDAWTGETYDVDGCNASSQCSSGGSDTPARGAAPLIRRGWHFRISTRSGYKHVFNRVDAPSIGCFAAL